MSRVLELVELRNGVVVITHRNKAFRKHPLRVVDNDRELPLSNARTGRARVIQHWHAQPPYMRTAGG